MSTGVYYYPRSCYYQFVVPAVNVSGYYSMLVIFNNNKMLVAMLCYDVL